MFEFLGSGLLGSLLGGVFRLAPELLKFFTRKEDNKHELAMLNIQVQAEQMRGEFKVEDKYVDFSIAQMNATQAAFEEQSRTASASYKWVAAASALVRPLVTYVLFGMYISIKATFIYYGLSAGEAWGPVLKANWTTDDFGLLNGILMFWFVSRAVDKYNRKVL